MPARSRARRHRVKDQGEEMPYADSNGVRLYYEEAGKGTPIVFVHEFAADLRSWEPQIRHFSRRYRCIAFNARGYPPSDVPKAKSASSQRTAADDIANVMRHAGLASAHIIGCSMGGFATVHFGLSYPRMAKSLTAVGIGSGSDHAPGIAPAFLAAIAPAHAVAAVIEDAAHQQSFQTAAFPGPWCIGTGYVDR
jgi:pimeloyl-ACP methyl ester carboxylesterase